MPKSPSVFTRPDPRFVMALLVPLAVLVVGPLQAAPLISLDRRIIDRTASGAPAAPVSIPRIAIPAQLVDQELLYYSTLIATDHPTLDLGMCSCALAVKLHAGEGKLELRCAPMAGFMRSAAGMAVTTFAMLGSSLADGIDPRSSFQVVSPASSLYQASEPTEVRDAEATADGLAFTQVFTLTARQQAQGEPSRISAAVRRWLVLRRSALEVREISKYDLRVAGLFTGGTKFLSPDKAGLPGDFVIRPDFHRPLRFLLHPSVPADRRPLISRAILSWNDTLQAVAGVRPIAIEDGQATDLPGTPGAIVVYWLDGALKRPYNAITQHVFDPRTGEIFGGGILLSERNLCDEDAREAGQIRMVQRIEVAAGQGFAADRMVHPLRSAGEFCAKPERFSSPEERDRRLVWCAAHESGHALGLRHNFEASADLARIPAGENATSVMDYFDEIWAPQHPLPYDAWALARAAGLAPPAGCEGPFRYGDDLSQQTDPDSNQFDRGEPVAFALAALAASRRNAGADADPQLLCEMLTKYFDILAKVLLHSEDARHETAVAAFERAFADAGADPAVAGGNQGATGMQYPAADALAKNLPARLAAADSISRVVKRGTIPHAALARVCGAMATCAIDAGHTDLYFVRAMMVSYLTTLGGPEASEALQRIAGQAEGAVSAPGAAATQDAAIAAQARAGLKEKAPAVHTD